ISIMEFHHRMGHISPLIAKHLIKKGFVTGVSLDTSTGEPVFCESCVKVKATRKPVPKDCQGPVSESFGDEVHTDVWGPSKI
ncbi:hypothetical protein JAAARDRAFT_109769, partial [Jaapia argillacea MUCL 33604]